MAFVGLILSATKFAGVLAAVTVAANAFSFSRFRKKNLRSFKSPIDESDDNLAIFNVDGSAEGENGFFFGLATAPAHVEDRLSDAWLQFAEGKPCEDSKSLHQLQPADAVMASAAGDGGSHQASSLESKRTMKKKPQKIAMEAMIRGFEKYIEEEEEESAPKSEHSHNVAAWHNVPHPNEQQK